MTERLSPDPQNGMSDIATKDEVLRLRQRVDDLARQMSKPEAADTPLSDPDHPLRREYRMAGRRLSYLEKRLPEAAHDTRWSFNNAAKPNLRIERDMS